MLWSAEARRSGTQFPGNSLECLEASFVECLALRTKPSGLGHVGRHHDASEQTRRETAALPTLCTRRRHYQTSYLLPSKP